MTKFEVKFGTITDALGKKRTGWFVVENGRPGYPYETKEKAEAVMEATKQIRHASTR